MQEVFCLDKQVVNLTIFLIKDYIENLKDCPKSSDLLCSSKLKPQFGLDGEIYYCDSNKKPPRWKPYLEELSNETINIAENASNKAIVLLHVQDRIMAIVFGYGRSFLKEECIERNFGLKVALNTINPNKMRSINAATIEDMVVTTQRQASYSTTQDEFGLNVTNDIMKGLTGEPYDPVYGNHISGKDSLVVSVFMEIIELKEKLELYYDAYKDERYKKIGFEWVDNVSEIRDSVQAEALDFELSSAIENHQLNHLHIAPPETTDWDRVIGFCYSGIGKKIDDGENYNLDLDLTEYVDRIKPGINVYQKIRRDKLYAMNSDGVPFAICSIYAALVFQTEYEEKNYILCSGTWYYVETSFFEQVNNFVKTKIPMSDVVLPDCPSDKDEGAYNEMVAQGNLDFCLMDKKLVSVENGPKKIEACDIFTRDKKMIHVKNKGQSAQLSHLFSQGKVSAECFVSDMTFRKQVFDIAVQKFGVAVFDYTQKPQSDEFEIVYAIIDTKNSAIEEKLPFFSKVNLMLTAQELDRMHFKFSVCFVRKV
jgi:uncharacterized protein (TIGR04141 family)